LKEQNKKALVIYVTAGDPDFENSFEAAKAVIEGGADVLEVGVPFSDPVADGPVIQEAMGRSLAAGGGLSQSLELVRRVREISEIPIVLFGYFNPLLYWGFEVTLQKVCDAGVDGLLVVDLPPEEAGPYKDQAAARGLDWVSLAAPTSGDKRVAAIAEKATGFLYLVSMTGVTGGELEDTSAVEEMVKVAGETSSIPTCVGFGVRDPASAARLGAIADGVVVGSEIVRALRRGNGIQPRGSTGERIGGFTSLRFR
jgi:tryptophan synthase alpha chain